MIHLKIDRRTRISYTLLRVVGEIFKIDKRTRTYGTDVQLYDAEIQMIKSIEENEGIHVIGLARILGVTKGAVSQTIMKLEKKGMIVKHADPKNLSRLVLRLTPKGETAYAHREKLYDELEDLVGSILDETTEENKAFLIFFLDALEVKIDAYKRGD